MRLKNGSLQYTDFRRVFQQELIFCHLIFTLYMFYSQAGLNIEKESGV